MTAEIGCFPACFGGVVGGLLDNEVLTKTEKGENEGFIKRGRFEGMEMGERGRWEM